MKATLLYHSKITLVHRQTDMVAIAELKVWRVGKTKDFLEGLKYSLFLVEKASGVVLVGFDNHKPKGHHLHLKDVEHTYDFSDVATLIDDFWNHAKELGFMI